MGLKEKYFGNENIEKIGNVELTRSEAEQLYSENKYIVTYSRIFQIFFSETQNSFYGHELYYKPGMAGRGRFYALTGKEINNLLGFALVNE